MPSAVFEENLRRASMERSVFEDLMSREEFNQALSVVSDNNMFGNEESTPFFNLQTLRDFEQYSLSARVVQPRMTTEEIRRTYGITPPVVPNYTLSEIPTPKSAEKKKQSNFSKFIKSHPKSFGERK